MIPGMPSPGITGINALSWTNRRGCALIREKARNRENSMSDNGPRSGRTGANAKARMRDDYALTTRGVTVTVRSFFLADQSRPDENVFVWAYRVRIENHGTETVQLLRRTWQITDARGRTQHVHGPGVVGEQPSLRTGQSFEYTSGTPLDTPSGIMVGTYHMVVPDSGEKFDVAIPAFSLDSPHQSSRVH
jgi:ApaG protein